jgi:SAM-dependent methyltransferase
MPSTDSRPSVIGLVYEYVLPIVVINMLIFRGFPPAIWYMIKHPWDVFFPSVWHKQILNGGQAMLLAAADEVYGPYKRDILSLAYGKVLEIGAGTGETVKYYDPAKVDVVFGVEPNIEALGALRAKLVEAPIADKYQILACGIEEEDKLTEAGIGKGTIDTIVCVGT